MRVNDEDTKRVIRQPRKRRLSPASREFARSNRATLMHAASVEDSAVHKLTVAQQLSGMAAILMRIAATDATADMSRENERLRAENARLRDRLNDRAPESE